jgi:hypothetical protein
MSTAPDLAAQDASTFAHELKPLVLLHEARDTLCFLSLSFSLAGIDRACILLWKKKRLIF